MEFEWDPRKSHANLRKHGVLFADAVAVFEDELSLTLRDPYSDEEDRWIALGRDALSKILVVVYTWRNDAIRIISARVATPREQEDYRHAGPWRRKRGHS